MSAEVIDVTGLPPSVVGHIRELVRSLQSQLSAGPPAGARLGVLDFLDGLPAGNRSQDFWDELEREFQAERDSWER
jgi:hypothetical protein